MSSQYQVSIIICTYNREKLLQLCINSIAALNFPANNLELIVINNNSTDNTAQVLASIPSLYPHINFKYINEERQGIGYARSRGALEASGNIVAYIDDDCLADSFWLRSIVDFYDQHPDAASTGGRIIPKYLTPVADWFGKYFWGLVGNYDLSKNVFQMTGVRYPSGANMHFRKRAFDQYGYFDGNLGRSGKSLMAGEEKAMYLKLLKGNEKIYYLPDAIVHHHVEGNKFNKQYVKQHSMGIGASERLMNKESIWKLTLKLLEYVAKLGYAVAYGFLYVIRGEFSKMSMLVKFRWWVILGFLFPQKS